MLLVVVRCSESPPPREGGLLKYDSVGRISSNVAALVLGVPGGRDVLAVKVL